jgi:hypothetical protein
MRKAAAALAVLTLIGPLTPHARAQTDPGSVSGADYYLPQAGAVASWTVNFSYERIVTIRVTSNSFDPRIVLRRSDGTTLTPPGSSGPRGPLGAVVTLRGNAPGAFGSITVTVTGNGPGNYHFEVRDQPAQAAPGGGGLTLLSVPAGAPAPRGP